MQAGRSGAPLRGATDMLRVHASVFQPGAGEEQMTRARDQFAELTQRGQEGFAAAVHAWEQAARSLTTGAAAGVPKARLSDLGTTVDAAFDFAAQMLAEQREFTKSLMSAGSQALVTAARRAMGDDQSDTAADATAPVAELPRPVAVEPAPTQPGSAEPASTQAPSADSSAPDRARGDDASDRIPDRTPNQASKGTPDQPSSPGPDRASSRSSDRASDQGADRPSVVTSDRGSSQSADRPTSRAPDQASSQDSGPA